MATGVIGDQPLPNTKPASSTTKKTTTTAKKTTTKSSTASKTTASKSTTSATNTVDKKLLAQRYGWTLSVLQGIPELWNLFNQAVKGNWSPDEFGARVKATTWYQTHSDQYRQMYVLEKSDPSKWARIQTEMFSKVHDLASSMGVKYDADLFGKVTRQALYNGWSDAQIRNALGGMLDFASGSHFGGDAGQAEATLRAYAYNMGVKLGDSTLKTWLQQMAKGDKTIEDFQAYMQTVAEQTFPAFAQQIKSGVTVRQLADPYIQSMASILEVNANQLDLNDPTIRKALTDVGSDGTNKGGVPLWQFEYQLRQDPRWLKTNNARESINSVAHSILKDWGFAF